jgi:Tol biopolymer transport system component
LVAQPFDPRRLELTGEAVQIASEVPNPAYSVSASDVLVYSDSNVDVTTVAGVRGVIRGQLTWFDRQGRELTRFADPGSYRTLEMSPDGSRLAFDRADPQNPTTRNIWLYDFAQRVTTRFTFGSSWDSDPVWSPDGTRIAYGSARGGGFDLYQKAANLAGEEELLLQSDATKLPTSWSPDGRLLLYFTPLSPQRIWRLRLDPPADRKVEPFDSSEVPAGVGRFSPDGRWIAYSAQEGASSDIYVRSSTATAGQTAARSGKWMVSVGGGNSPRWRRDGQELFYLAPNGTAMAVDVSTKDVFRAGVPHALFKTPDGLLFWEVSADGKQFLMPVPSAPGIAGQRKATIVLNWQAALR